MNTKDKLGLFNIFLNSVFREDQADPLPEEIYNDCGTDHTLLCNITLHIKKVHETLTQLKPGKATGHNLRKKSLLSCENFSASCSLPVISQVYGKMLSLYQYLNLMRRKTLRALEGSHLSA